MARKRKCHSGPLADIDSNVKRRRTDATLAKINYVNHPVLGLYYENVMSLREYILATFPNSSRSRKQRLKAVPIWTEERCQNNIAEQIRSDVHDQQGTKDTPSFQSPNAQAELSKLLDTTIVTFHDPQSGKHDRPVAAKGSPSYAQNVLQLSQRLRSTMKSTPGEQAPSQVEV